MINRLAAVVLALLLASCASGPAPSLPSGSAAYDQVPPGDVLAPRMSVIAPNDELSVLIFREPDLSQERAIVDSDGKVQIPLLGPVTAAGLTASEFAQELQRQLGARYLVDPSVTVAITRASLRRVTVTGAVTKPGMYDMNSRISLIDAVALASGPTNTAKFNQVVVFRRAEGERLGAVFDLGLISAGKAPDVEILPGDQVIVGNDGLKQLYRDALTAAPLISIFRPFN
ncbi:polysaccharide biosynthesis/export family protein [Pontixanthobacter luteolus]|uniref:polysaccharide biosynthesis/export family protein n=1 Tax=Pontixanthobacter luteolus TaxID=295089 RepID=UPI002302BF06|nr:polysaccharide biosynthesis/export family protein [Pontixanthobacter luteolus]